MLSVSIRSYEARLRAVGRMAGSVVLQLVALCTLLRGERPVICGSYGCQTSRVLSSPTALQAAPNCWQRGEGLVCSV